MWQWLSHTTRKQRRFDRWDLARPLFPLSPRDSCTIGGACENFFVTGGNGGGKTSGTGDTVLLSSFAAGFGSLINTVKADEVERVRTRAALTGRLDDLIIVEPGGPWKFNPLAFELSRKGPVGSACENVVSLFDSLMQVGDRSDGHGGGRQDERFWRLGTNECVRNAVSLIIQAGERLSVDLLYRVVSSAPPSMDAVRSESFRQGSECFRLAGVADRRPMSESARRDFGLTCDYWFDRFPQIADKTRSVFVQSFASQISLMQRGTLHELFGGETTFTPADAEQGRIIVVGLPTKLGETGRIANLVLKHCWQRHMETRDVNVSPIPCLWYCDEFQGLATSHDPQFLATSRTVRAPACLLTQNMPGLHAALGGGDKGRAEADAITALCATKVMHANSCPVTNTWCSTLIGRSRQLMASGNTSYSADEHVISFFGGRQHRGQMSAGFTQVYEFEVQPSVFTRLRTGGPANCWNVDAIVFQNGKIFNQTGKTWMPVTFRQRH